jgi:hypothetical protein
VKRTLWREDRDSGRQDGVSEWNPAGREHRMALREGEMVSRIEKMVAREARMQVRREGWRLGTLKKPRSRKRWASGKPKNGSGSLDKRSGS